MIMIGHVRKAVEITFNNDNGCLPLYHFVSSMKTNMKSVLGRSLSEQEEDEMCIYLDSEIEKGNIIRKKGPGGGFMRKQ